MKFIDTHAHLQFEKFDQDREAVVKENSEKLLAIINPGADLNSSEKGVSLAQSVHNFYAAVGVHPHHVNQWDQTYLPQLEKLIQEDKVVAVGEIGLDNHIYVGYPEPNIKQQTEILVPQIELAQKYKKPILFHCRKAYDELYLVLKNYQPIDGLIHCFMGNLETAKKFVDLGLLISFAGNITYKANEQIRETASFLPEGSILIETDSPYLTPEPLRGERNQPINVALVAQAIAGTRNTTIENVCDFTVKNAKNLFQI